MLMKQRILQKYWWLERKANFQGKKSTEMLDIRHRKEEEAGRSGRGRGERGRKKTDKRRVERESEIQRTTEEKEGGRALSQLSSLF